MRCQQPRERECENGTGIGSAARNANNDNSVYLQHRNTKIKDNN